MQYKGFVFANNNHRMESWMILKIVWKMNVLTLKNRETQPLLVAFFQYKSHSSKKVSYSIEGLSHTI